ncbi:glycoside hydrolase family 3 protein [Planctobacterium marinum]|uniref:glycoside hydrolase family 3 protein n=1 Tax=Planctobacterium marinum TaxID=1631968 RepID=UPI001E326F1E|nr:exo 1,3/1,4-beta-D-glucan glucohydrolase [Planctobacterium marinum]MCC2604605.1 exo 1,3/1,4-beta-D-glucan glucohydrolase [Planctobacterium marinum]
MSKTLSLLASSIATLLLAGCQPAVTEQNTGADTSRAEPNVHAIWPKLDIAIKPDAAVEAKVKELLSGMTLPQKVAQVIQPEIRDISVEDMRRYGFGSYLNGGGAYPDNNKHATVSDWVALAEAMYQASIDDSLDGSGIPTMWGTDAVHGHNNVIGATIFPHNIGLGAANDPDLIKRIAGATSIEVQATGIDWIFAPTVAAARDDRWGRTYESYSEDPAIIRDYSEAIVQGLQGDDESDFFGDDKVISTVKHFIGDGGTEKGDDQGNNIADEATLFTIHAQGYVGGLSAGSQTVMASFNSWHGEKIHGKKYLLTDVLKTRMGFDGFVVGDWNGHGQIKGCSNENCAQAMNAGLDVYMVPTQAWKPLYENLIAQVQSGEIPQSRLDDAVTRVLRVKVRAGLFDKPSPANRPHANKQSLIGAQAHRDIAREAVRKSLVLLKNNQQTLPLSPNQKVLVAGDAAHNIGKQSGGWSITWQGTGNNNSDFPGGTSIYDGIASVVTQAGGQVELSEQGTFTEKPDVAIVVFGEEPYAEGNGDLDNVEYQRGSKSDLALLKSLKAQDIPVVSLFISGRPMWVNPEINASDAFVAAWLPGSEGQGIADVLFTDSQGEIQHDFHGKLSFSWPKTPQQQANKGEADYAPLFPYGYGLSYRSDAKPITMLAEDNGSSGATLDDRALYQGAVKAPWQLAAVDAQGQQVMTASVLNSDAIKVRTRDRRVQEDALQITWLNDAAFGLYSPFPDDLMGFLESGASLQFDVNVTSISDSVQLKLICMDNCVNSIDLTATLSAAQGNAWQTVQLPLQCLAKQGVNFTKIMSPFALHATQGTQLQISDVILTSQPEESASIPQSCRSEQ